MTVPNHEIVTYHDADVVETREFGRIDWRFGERVEWHVVVIDGEVIGRRRTRGEALALLRSRQISGS